MTDIEQLQSNIFQVMSNKSRSEPENVILKCYNLKEKTFFEILLCFVFTVSVSLYTFNLFPFFSAMQI